MEAETDCVTISGVSFSCSGYRGLEGSAGYQGDVRRRMLEKESRTKGRDQEKIDGDRESDKSEG